MTKDLTDFFDAFSPEVSIMARAIYEAVAEIMLPDKAMWIDHADKMITFGTAKNMQGEICYIKPLKDSVNLGFFHGANLNDPARLLQGTGKLLRHIKFRKGNSPDMNAVKTLLSAALEEHNSRQGK